MPNLPINQLPGVSTVNPDSLFVLEQNGNASKVTADTFRRQWIGEQGQFKPKGKYNTLTALRNAVPNPALGDYYYVGSSAPYTIYAALNIGQSNPWVSVGAIGTDVQSTASQLQFPGGVNTGSGDISSFLVGNTARNIKDADALDMTESGIILANGADLNDYTTPGVWRANTNSIAESILNCPVNVYFKLIVTNSHFSDSGYVYQFVISSSFMGKPQIYFRTIHSGDISVWSRLTNAKYSNENLLQNPWFTINQYDFTSGAGYPTRYFIDRWKVSGYTAANLSLSGHTLRVDNSSASGSTYIIQPLENTLSTNRYVFSANFTEVSGTVTIGFYKDGTAVYSTNVTSTGIAVCNAYVTYADGVNEVRIRAGAGASFRVSRCKLEQGDESTLDNDLVPPPYAQTLLECQRFFYRLKAGSSYTLDIGTYMTPSTGAARIPFRLPTEMRGNPTVTPSSTGAFYAYVGSTSKASTEISAYTTSAANDVRTVAVTCPDLEAYTPYRYVLRAGEYIDFIAEI